MSNYAMICYGRVIDILKNQDVTPVWPPSAEGYEILAVKCDDSVEIGMAYDIETKKYSEYTSLIINEGPIIPQPTQLDLIQAAVEKSNAELRQEGAEAVTLELIERGIL